jgi:hypothetical protein
MNLAATLVDKFGNLPTPLADDKNDDEDDDEDDDDEDDDDEDDDNDEEMQEAAEGAGACGGSSTQQQVEGSNAKYRASLMRRCMEPDIDEFKTTEQVQAAIEGVHELMGKGHVDVKDGLSRLKDLDQRKDELKDQEQQVKRGRDETESGNPAHKGDNQRTN